MFIPQGLLRNSVLYVTDLCVQERRSLIDFLPNYMSLGGESLIATCCKEQLNTFIFAWLRTTQTFTGLSVSKRERLLLGTSPWKQNPVLLRVCSCHTFPPPVVGPALVTSWLAVLCYLFRHGRSLGLRGDAVRRT